MNTNSVMLSESLKVDTVTNKIIYVKLKRGFDILFGLFGILLMVPIAFIIKAVSIYNRDYHSIFYKIVVKKVSKTIVILSFFLDLLYIHSSLHF